MLQFLRCLGSGFVFSSGARAVCLRIKGFKVVRPLNHATREIFLETSTNAEYTVIYILNTRPQ